MRVCGLLLLAIWAGCGGGGGGDPQGSPQTDTPRPETLTKSLDFGDVIMTASASRRMTIVNKALDTEAEVGLPALPPGFSIPGTAFPLRIGPQETVTLDVRYDPVALGTLAFDLVFPHNGEGGPMKVAVTATTSTWPEEMVVEFGDVPLDALGDTPWLEVDVPAHAISVTVEATATTDETIELIGLEWPDGFAPLLPPLGLQWPTVKRGIRSVTVPWTDASAEQLVPGGGTYRFRFRRESGPAPTLKVRALLENRPGAVVTGGVIDLNIFAAASYSITPEQVPLWSQAMIAEADALLAQIGLTIGNVTGYVLDPTYDTMAQLGDPSKFFDLFAESGSAAATRLNVFVIAMPGGTAGMVQGPASNGWPESGVAVGHWIGKTLAHEMGHYLGLHHPPGDAITDTNALGGNVMSVGTGTMLTPGQGHVILRHPLVRSP